MIKLIASDMDGTLLNNQMQVTKQTIKAIEKAQAAGVEFITATGRGIGHAMASLETAKIHVPMILLNGALVLDAHGETIFTVPIPREKAFEIMDVLEEEHIYYEIFTAKHVYSENQSVRIDFFSERVAELSPTMSQKRVIAQTSSMMTILPIDYVADMRKTVIENEEEILKIIAFDKHGPATLQTAETRINALGELAIAASEASNIEINHVNAQKGIAVARYAESMGITADEVMAIGDNFNDVSMLRYAGTSFAMGNAEPEVKKEAKYVTVTNEENGVAKAIEQILSE
ncbi:haloacid dehalogenase [Enterococcus florum]|uniref:Haloacid dehalogenase n=1 Tax=Enterococcus florum TaxID=2480627 RepID=A0A4P5P8Q3_9ENTE|nr:Cof-type HAD-IIB family hydrolase [Enterococcus florum]GCF94425.1 haloacid dehalogenase [Enterococcus florum]